MRRLMSACASGAFQSIGTVTVAQLVVGAGGYSCLTVPSNGQTDQLIGWSRYRWGIAGAGGSGSGLAAAAGGANSVTTAAEHASSAMQLRSEGMRRPLCSGVGEMCTLNTP